MAWPKLTASWLFRAVSMAALPKDPVYTLAELAMMLRVIGGSKGPGLVTLETLRQISAGVEAGLMQRLDYLEATDRVDEANIAALQSGANAETAARIAADTAEAKARSDADAALSTRIAAADNRIVPFTASLVLPAGISLLSGKSTRTVAIAGLKRNDNLVVTPNAALPASVAMGEVYCLADGTLTVVLLNTAALNVSIATTQTIPLGVLALRP